MHGERTPAETTGLGPHLAALTAPDAEFALVEAVVDGVPLRLYRRGPHTLREMLLDTAGFGDRPFTVYRGERRSYAEHLRLVLGLAAALRDGYGLAPGDRVAIAMRNYPEWSPVFWATQVAGLVAVPLNAWWSGPELVWAVGDSGASVVVADGERAARLTGHVDVPVVRVRGEGESPAREWDDLVAALDLDAAPPDIEVAPSDTSTILYTSGTTGRPKGAVHSHLNHVTNALNVLLTGRAVARANGAAPSTAQPGTLLSYPLFHIAGLNSLYGAVLTGAKIATQYRWDVDEARAPRLVEVTLELARAVLPLGGLDGDPEEALRSGAAAEAFGRMVSELGGPADFMECYAEHLERAPVIRHVQAERDGVVTAHATRDLGLAVVVLGGGRTADGQPIDHAVGLDQVAAPGTPVGPGDSAPLAIVHARDEATADAAEAAIRAAITVGDTTPTDPPVVQEVLR